MMKEPCSANFGFLARLEPSLHPLAASAEALFPIDASASIGRLRTVAEKLTEAFAEHSGNPIYDREDQSGLINRLQRRGLIHPSVADLLHGIRQTGNRAVHDTEGSPSTALRCMRQLRRAAFAMLKTLGRVPKAQKLGPFVPPALPANAEEALRKQIAEERATAEAAKNEAAAAREAFELERALREDTEGKLAATKASAKELEDLANELIENESHEVALLRAQLEARPKAEQKKHHDEMVEAAHNAGENLDLTEAETREIIDKQLRDAGWLADTKQLRHSRGTRPQKGKNIAIAEWPTKNGPADYALFVGLKLVGIAEAKRERKDVSDALQQAKRYARGITFDGFERAGGPYGEDGDLHVPFLFATNGRPFFRQWIEKSGIWYLDVRRPTNLSRALEGWVTPEGLSARLEQDRKAAEAKLASDPIEVLKLRDYQEAAIVAVEDALKNDQREILLAMATGTGKTRTCIGLTYRLLKSGWFNRILFVVDRSALAEQAANAFKTAKVDQAKALAEIFDLKDHKSPELEQDTRLHIATIQSLVNRTNGVDKAPLPVDTYDCIVVDESHRGYTLDAGMSDVETTFRDQSEYVSTYRRVLDHFDAVKIGLTATPALHTSEIFGAPVFSYPYREAVVDGFLVDHLPPVRIETRLSKEGISFRAGEEVAAYSKSAKGQLWLLDDEVHFEVTKFNREVITEGFNRAVCQYLVDHLDPDDDDKTLVFCVNEEHAKTFTRILQEEFAEKLGSLHESAILKITGQSDKPQELIRRFKNERRPNIVVTVDLLTTGIDVPAISNLVFMRRVRSRILYDQMLGRATRLCPDIGKEVFRVYDAVDIYATLEKVSDMKPVATKRNTTYEQLIEELTTVDTDEQRDVVLCELIAKLQRKRAQVERVCSEEFEVIAGDPIESFLKQLRSAQKQKQTEQAADILRSMPKLGKLLDRKLGRDMPVLIAPHEDEVVATTQGYGPNRERPEDYLDGFARFVRENMNTLPALILVTQKPRDLTRADLKSLKLALDEHGYTEAGLRSAWKQQSNADIAASIVGYIRQAALGDALLSHAQRVEHALQKILARRDWDRHQKKWLKRIAEQMVASTVVDRTAFDALPFSIDGGFRRINKKFFDGELEQWVGELSEAVWV